MNQGSPGGAARLTARRRPLGRRDQWVTWSAYAAFCALGLVSRAVPVAFLAFVAFGLAFPLWWGRRDPAALGFTRRRLGQALAWGAVAGIGWALYTYAAFRAGSSLPPFWPLQVVIGLPVWLLILSPFQEFFFRGWFQPRLQLALGHWPGLVVTAVAFTAWHAFPPLEGTPTATLPLSSLLGIVSTVGLGLLLGYVYQRTETIAAPWLAHALGGIGLVLIGQMVFLRYVP